MDAKATTKTPTLDDYGKMVEGRTCRWCGGDLPTRVDRYDHEGGWRVEGFDRPQWLSVRCRKCGYDWSLWKLGVSGAGASP